MRKGKLRYVCSLTILLNCTLLAGCSLMPKDEEALRPPLNIPVEQSYDTAKVVKGTIVREIKGMGTFESRQIEDCQFTSQGGRIGKIYVSAGDFVKKGDILVELTMDGLELQLKEQAFALEKAKYEREKARADQNQDPENAKLADMQLDIEQIKYNQLLEIDKNKQLRANMDGQVVFVEDMKTGDVVNPYQTLIRIADPKKLRLAVDIDNAADFKDVAVGMKADVSSSETVSGQVVQTPSSAPYTKEKDLAEKYAKTLYIETPNLPSDAKIGSVSFVTISMEHHDNAIKIPRSVMRTYLDRNVVQVLDGTRLREVDVEPGIKSATEVEIVRGLKEGQDIVLQN